PAREGLVRERRLRADRIGVRQSVDVDPRRATGVLLAVGHLDGLEQTMGAEREHPEWVAPLPGEAFLRVVERPDELAGDLGQVGGLGELGDTDDVGPPGDPNDVGPDRSGVGLVDPALVRGLEQLALLVLGGRVEPNARALHIEMATVLAEAALAHVEDLLACEEGTHDYRPLFEREDSGHIAVDHVVRISRTTGAIGGTWRASSSSKDGGSGPTSQRRGPRQARWGHVPVSCSVTVCRRGRGVP